MGANSDPRVPAAAGARPRPRSGGLAKPDLTVILKTYQNERYAAQALKSVLAQEGVVAEIIISDDASTDRSFDVVSALVKDYAGPHQVSVRRNAKNQGVGHTALLAELAACEVVVIAHGDDIAEPRRCRRLLDEMDAHGAYTAGSNFLEIDEAGRPTGLAVPVGESRAIPAEEIARYGWQPLMMGSTLAFRRAVHTTFPRLDSRHTAFGGDTLMPFRGTLLGGMWYIHEPLVRRRKHPNQVTNLLFDLSTREAFVEAQCGHAYIIQHALARDLRHHLGRATAKEANRLEKLVPIVAERLEQLSADWVAARLALYRDGWRPTWVSRGEFEIARRRGLQGLRTAAGRLWRRWRWQLFHR